MERKHTGPKRGSTVAVVLDEVRDHPFLLVKQLGAVVPGQQFTNCYIGQFDPAFVLVALDTLTVRVRSGTGLVHALCRQSASSGCSHHFVGLERLLDVPAAVASSARDGVPGALGGDGEAPKAAVSQGAGGRM